MMKELPSPPADRSGWPWTEEGATPAPARDLSWPKITIVTPSFNQGAFLEETIRSVLLQGYPNLEYIVMDGGSSDASPFIIRKYEPWLSDWVSKRDRGQSDAINKGFARGSGDIFTWLCSDDLLLPGALHAVARAFRENPEASVVAGSCYFQVDGKPERSGERKGLGPRLERMPYVAGVWQPSTFFRRELVTRPELVRCDLNYCMDRELWCYLTARAAKWKWLDEPLSIYRVTGANKSIVGKHRILRELEGIYRDYARDARRLTFWLGKVWLPLVLIRRSHHSAAMRFFARFVSRSLGAGLRVAYPGERVRAMEEEYYMYGMQ